ncbi:nicotinate (nicotinamide) nucleotide adenylyltransferase [Robertkochia aurantiaca]|uniref:nicotinate (nicotinamide) nucleotide adenylyltransferase n=1 Tax=Robertkochia aurantiaca TaxID=2873700 RepID=UPI001CCCC2AF|nr:nicotinate (nicotinamide) nucleotide adenylyltransferase [Robertkochia sp. 3YJGBD-33]
MKRIGLYFGTFNPIHIGHLIIANHFAEYSDLEEVWLVVTPHNPHKKKKTLLDDRHRYEMVYRATESFPKLRPSDIEFGLDQPNYTVNTLAYLKEKYPEYQFSLIMGEDNLRSLSKWRNFEYILEHHPIYVYPRNAGEMPDSEIPESQAGITIVNAPQMEISSTFIRKAIGEGKEVRPLLPESVWEYIDHNNFYRS